MQISLTHSIARHAKECTSNMARAEAIHLWRILGIPLGVVLLRSHRVPPALVRRVSRPAGCRH